MAEGSPEPWEMRLAGLGAQEHPNLQGLRVSGDSQSTPGLSPRDTQGPLSSGTRPESLGPAPTLQARVSVGSVALLESTLSPGRRTRGRCFWGREWVGGRGRTHSSSPSGRALQPVFLVAALLARGARVSLGPSWG